MGKLVLLFTLVPIVETYLLYLLGTLLGFWPTVGIVLLTGVLGAYLAKREGLKVWRSWSEALAQGRIPEEGILGGVLVLIGGVLLVTPGVLTDVTGMALLVPPSRRFIAEHVRARLEKKIADGSVTTTRVRVDLGGGRYAERVEMRRGRRSRDPDVIDAEGEVLEERRRGEDRGQLGEG
ncbi:MAG TPA: FxsA family protein [Sandaracinaceae bacterium LLY-WYZ-13_1]|nr:FxsA family protein [Sandaracinaceae bacterium LLY-WYZ-13_1]